MTTKTIIKKLNQITKESSDSLKKEVALEALEYGDPKEFLNAVYNYGCVSGWVGSLIYYSDTHKFYDKHYYEIEELREEFEKDTWIPVKIHGDLKNFFARFAFEQTAYNLSLELGLQE